MTITQKDRLPLLYRFMYAFNHESLDVLESVLHRKKIVLCGCPAIPLASGFNTVAQVLLQTHRQMGDLKLGQVRYSSGSTTLLPYIDDVAYFTFSIDEETLTIQRISAHLFGEMTFENEEIFQNDRWYLFEKAPNDNSRQRISEFFKTNLKEPETLFNDIPHLVDVSPFKPLEKEPFALKLTYDNGKCRKFVLPESSIDTNRQSATYEGFVFDQTVWHSSRLKDDFPSEIPQFPNRGQTLVFSNGFSMSWLRCYEKSHPYALASINNRIRFTNDRYQLRQLWTIDAFNIRETTTPNVFKVFSSRFSTFFDANGQRLTSLDDARLSDLQNSKMIKINPHKYDWIGHFYEGIAPAIRNGKRWIVDSEGSETPCIATGIFDNYLIEEDYQEGHLYPIRRENIFVNAKGEQEVKDCFGFADATGKEIIPCRYQELEYIKDYTFETSSNFQGGFTIVGIDQLNKTQMNTRLKGVIDTQGNEVIACQYEDINRFSDRTDVFMVMNLGLWGLMDCAGQVVAQCQFDWIYSDRIHNRIVFKKSTNKGVYDIKAKRILFEGAYENIRLEETGDIISTTFDTTVGRYVERVVNEFGQALFPSIYSGIHPDGDGFRVFIKNGELYKHGLIDLYGRTLLPCIYESESDEFEHTTTAYAFTKNGKKGLMGFDGKKITPTLFDSIKGLNRPFITVGKKKNGLMKYGLVDENGTEVLPADYVDLDWSRDGYYLLCSTKRKVEVLHVEELSRFF